MKHFLLLSLFILLFEWNTQAQINNHLLESNIELNDSIQESLCLDVYSNTFFKNNEYFNDIVTGYTLFGTQLKTQLAYNINPHVRIQAGLYARKDFGNETITHIAPLLSIKLQKNGYSLLMGNLEGNVSHRLIEPLYDYERFMLKHVENGLQIKMDRKKIWADTWMNWEVQQYVNSTFQEQFSAGHSSMTKLYTNEQKGYSFTLPIQLLVSHKGGQLDIDTTPLKTIANVATGLVFQYKNKQQNQLLKTIDVNFYLTHFNDLSPTKTLRYTKGNGLLANVQAMSKYDIGAALCYWSGSQYIASRGATLFQSEASIYGKQGYAEATRQLLFLRLLYQRRIFDALNVDVRFEPFIDLNKQTFEYSYSVYLTYKKDFTLINLSNGKKRKNLQQ